MAITNIHPIKKTLSLAISYIIDEEKTNGKILVSSNNCMAETATEEFLLTQENAQKGKVLAHHLIQAFLPNEITDPHLAHKIGLELTKEVLGDSHEYIVATHIDKGHIHNHIIFNSVDTIENKHYRSNINSYYNIREKSDNLCLKNNLNVIKDPPKSRRTKNKNKDLADKNTKITLREKIKVDINSLLSKVNNVGELFEKLINKGYQIKDKENTTFISPYSNSGVRANSLDKTGYYKKSNLSEIINNKEHIVHDKIKNDIDSAIEKAATMSEFKNLLKDKGYIIRAGETMSIKPNDYGNYIKENVLGEKYSIKNITKQLKENIQTYENKSNDISNVFEKIYKLNSEIKVIDFKIEKKKIQIPLLKDYYYLKPIIEKGNQVVFKDKYIKDNKDIYIKFENINLQMKNAGIEKLIPIEIEFKQLDILENKRGNLIETYNDLKEQSERIMELEIKEKEETIEKDIVR